jgi:hypothetical protein
MEIHKSIFPRLNAVLGLTKNASELHSIVFHFLNCLQILAMESTRKLHFFPPTNGMSPYYSPHMIIYQENLVYAKHCAIPFGTYVLAHTEAMRTNTQHPRTLDCIYLQYLSNKQGGHERLEP